MIYLVDYENVGEKGIKEVNKLSKEDRLILFYNDSSKISMRLHKIITEESNCKVEYYCLGQKGKNALDFELVTYLGYLIGENPNDNFVIISKDKGYSSAIDFWNVEKKLKNEIQLQESIISTNLFIKKSDISKAIEDKNIDFEINIDELFVILNRYKTKQGINNAIMKIYGSTKTGTINSAIKKLIKNKKGS